MTGNLDRKFYFFPLLIALLVTLLGLLAGLQYRSQGQISQSESERMKTNLRAATNRFAEDFDRELTNAYFGLQMEETILANKNWAEYRRRFDAWEASSAYPQIVESVTLARIDSAGSIHLSDFNRATGQFDSGEPTDEFERLREILKNRLSKSDFESPAPNAPLLPSVIESVPALVAPIVSVGLGNPAEGQKPPEIIRDYVIIRLDLFEIKCNLLPALARGYFYGTNDLDYNFAVVKQTSPAAVIYKSDPAVDDAEVLKFNDAGAGIFNIRLFGTGSLISEISQPRKIPPVNAATPKQMPFPAPAPPELNQIAARPISSDNQKGEWQLVVQHRRGSLEDFVEAARRRNLAISFGVLALLGVSATLIALTAKRARMLARQQTEFAANVSHELRTPLAVISLAGENLADGIIDVSPDARNYGVLIRDEAARLTSTIEQVLELSAGQTGKCYEFQPVDVARIIDQAVADCRAQINQNKFQIKRNFPQNLPPVSANESALLRAVQNLLTNAMKYSDESRSIQITAELIKNKNENEIVISIEDDGIGIESEELNEIFKPFCRGREAVEKQIQGTGLGLTLVKRIMDAHGGRVSVRSAPGCGSVFNLHLPTKRVKENF